MGEYSDELDRYLEAYEEKTGKTLRVPEQLIQRKLINQSIESGLFQTYALEQKIKLWQPSLKIF